MPRIYIDIESPDSGLSRGFGGEPGEDIDEGGLACAVRPQQSENGAARDFEVDIAQGFFGRAFARGGVCFAELVGFYGENDVLGWYIHAVVCSIMGDSRQSQSEL